MRKQYVYIVIALVGEFDQEPMYRIYKTRKAAEKKYNELVEENWDNGGDVYSFVHWSKAEVLV